MLSAKEARNITERALGNKIIRVQRWMRDIGLENKIRQSAKKGLSQAVIMTNSCPDIETFSLLMEDKGYEIYTVDCDIFSVNTCVKISWEYAD